jgi:uncharacterized protein DUF748
MAHEPRRYDPPESEPARPPEEAAGSKRARRAERGRHGIHRHPVLAGLGIVVAVLLVAVFAASFFLDGYLRRTMESRINQRLHGYHLSLDHAHLQLLNLRLTLRGLTIRQDANPEPPVAAVDRLRASVEWKELVRLHLVGDLRFDRPRLHIDLPQLRREVSDQVSLKNRGWQQALESIYPLKFNSFQVNDGDVVYVDEDAAHPLHLSHVQLSAENIRNIQSRDRTYPSPVHAEAVVFDRGRATLDGNADFLAVPFPGVHALYHVANVPLAQLRPVAQRGNVVIRGGDLASHGEIEFAPKVRYAHVQEVKIAGLRLDYLHSAATAAAEKARGEKVAATARKAAAAPNLDLKVDRIAVTGGDLGLVDRSRKPGYRVYLDHAGVTVDHLSNQGPADVRVAGRFMGSGTARARARFREQPSGPFLDLDAAIENASLTSINDLLRSFVHFDVAAGTFSVYTQMKIENGRISGYVKPLFQHVQVYDPRQDQKKSLGQKIKEKLANVAAKVLTNRQHHDVATVADLGGRVDQPHTSIWQIAWRAIGNAFVKAILPGFEHTYGPGHDNNKK